MISREPHTRCRPPSVPHAAAPNWPPPLPPPRPARAPPRPPPPTRPSHTRPLTRAGTGRHAGPKAPQPCAGSPAHVSAAAQAAMSGSYLLCVLLGALSVPLRAALPQAALNRLAAGVGLSLEAGAATVADLYTCGLRAGDPDAMIAAATPASHHLSTLSEIFEILHPSGLLVGWTHASAAPVRPRARVRPPRAVVPPPLSADTGRAPGPGLPGAAGGGRLCGGALASGQARLGRKEIERLRRARGGLEAEAAARLHRV